MALPTDSGTGLTDPAGLIRADTYAGQPGLDATMQSMIKMARGLDLGYTGMAGMVTRSPIPRGHKECVFPFQNSVFVAQDYNDGDEINQKQRFSLSTITLTPAMLQITFRITDRAKRMSMSALGAMAGKELARAQQRRTEADLLKLATNAGVQVLNADRAGSAVNNQTKFNLDLMRQAETMLTDLEDKAGSVPDMPYAMPISPYMREELLTSLGARSVQGSVDREAIPEGLTRRILQTRWWMGDLLGIPLIMSSYMHRAIGTVNTPEATMMFARSALLLGMSLEWTAERFRSESVVGDTVRSVCDYGKRVGTFPKHIVRIPIKVR